MLNHQVNPIFVTGAPRSGTTLLRLLLTTHPGICIPPESLFFISLEKEYGNIGNLSNKIEDFLNSLYDKSRFPKFCQWGVNRQALSRDLKRYNFLSYALAINSVYQGYLQQFAPTSLVWGDKNPCHIHQLEIIWKHFSSARVVLILRDFRACYSSLQAILSKELRAEKVWTGPRDLEGMARQWDAVTKLVEKYRDCDQFFLIRYEELVANPSIELLKLCNWLGLDFDESMLLFYQKNAELNLVLPSQAGLNPMTFKPIESARIDAWRNELSAIEVENIELTNWRNLEKLGYKCVTQN